MLEKNWLKLGKHVEGLHHSLAVRSNDNMYVQSCKAKFPQYLTKKWEPNYHCFVDKNLISDVNVLNFSRGCPPYLFTVVVINVRIFPVDCRKKCLFYNCILKSLAILGIKDS